MLVDVISGLLATAGLFVPLSQAIKVPYAVILAGLGLLFRSLNRRNGTSFCLRWGRLSSELGQWCNIADIILRNYSFSFSPCACFRSSPVVQITAFVGRYERCQICSSDVDVQGTSVIVPGRRKI